MASVFKPADKSKYYILYYDENGRRRKQAGTTDKAVTQRIANKLEEAVALRKAGLIDPQAEAYRDHAAKPLSDHLADWVQSIEAKGATKKHAELFTARARRIVALVMGANLSDVAPLGRARRTRVAEIVRFRSNTDRAMSSARLAHLTADRVQSALATLKREGRSHETCNHHRAAIRSFSRWAYETHRTKDDILRGVTGYNAKEDRRHDRRTVSLEELHRLIEVAQSGPDYRGMTGPARALCYRLAVATGLRYSEIASITSESFDWKAPSIAVEAAYTKNGQTAVLPIQDALADDLAAFCADVPPGCPVFALSRRSGAGAGMLRFDLRAAGIDYRDKSGLVFDFHSLRCELATLADAAGVSPRVVQKLMRHSSLELTGLTGRYTRPRAVDIEAAAGLIPNLKPKDDRQALVATGTGPRLRPSAPQTAPSDSSEGPNIMALGDLTLCTHRKGSPLPP
jgi:integrase